MRSPVGPLCSTISKYQGGPSTSCFPSRPKSRSILKGL